MWISRRKLHAQLHSFLHSGQAKVHPFLLLLYRTFREQNARHPIIHIDHVVDASDIPETCPERPHDKVEENRLNDRSLGYPNVISSPKESSGSYVDIIFSF